VTPLADLEALLTEHRPDGLLTAPTRELTPNGYRREVTCPFGVTFERGSRPARRPRIS